MSVLYDAIRDESNLKLYNSTSEIFGHIMNDKKKRKKIFKKWKHFDWIIPKKEGWYLCMVFENEELKEIPLYFIPDDASDNFGKWFHNDTDDKEEYYNFIEKDQPYYNRKIMFMWRKFPAMFV